MQLLDAAVLPGKWGMVVMPVLGPEWVSLHTLRQQDGFGVWRKRALAALIRAHDELVGEISARACMGMPGTKTCFAIHRGMKLSLWILTGLGWRASPPILTG